MAWDPTITETQGEQDAGETMDAADLQTDVQGACGTLSSTPMDALLQLAFSLAAWGVSPVLCVSPAAESFGLRVGTEFIQVTTVSGRCVLVTESGKVLGYITDTQIMDEILEAVYFSAANSVS
ncbi:hypothetical protein [Spirillospora sp. CA-128828]|uniref:hypothetical protein n=1 Tax=Spirillospora sp. CA-128828 TaxID=3240033 RepID=UPI003D9306CE